MEIDDANTVDTVQKSDEKVSKVFDRFIVFIKTCCRDTLEILIPHKKLSNIYTLLDDITHNRWVLSKEDWIFLINAFNNYSEDTDAFRIIKAAAKSGLQLITNMNDDEKKYDDYNKKKLGSSVIYKFILNEFDTICDFNTD